MAKHSIGIPFRKCLCDSFEPSGFLNHSGHSSYQISQIRFDLIRHSSQFASLHVHAANAVMFHRIIARIVNTTGRQTVDSLAISARLSSTGQFRVRPRLRACRQ